MTNSADCTHPLASATIEVDMNMVGPMYTALALYPNRGRGARRVDDPLAFRWYVVERPDDGPIEPVPVRPPLGGTSVAAAQRALEERYAAHRHRLRTSWRDGGEAALYWRLYEDGTID
jgi:hypothetical protein